MIFLNMISKKKNDRKIMCVLPPPNVTGSLHIGHALNITLQDIKMRFLSQQGYSSLWIPGTDHAGIATQLVAQRLLEKQNINYKNMSKTEFKKNIYQVKDMHEEIVINQIKQMDTIINWDQYCFTLDPKVCETVFLTFQKLFNEGLIYQDMRLTHWDPKLKTALSDLEVDYRTDSGYLFYIEYKLKKCNQTTQQTADHSRSYAASTHTHAVATELESVIVATTRPETIFGDNALCVHPDDPRYKHLIGSYAYIPILNKKIPIIADKAVEISFGTGILKVTSAHAVLDFELCKRHKLECYNIIDENGKMINVPEEFNGLICDEARVLIEKHLTQLKALKNIENIKHQVPYGEKSGNKLECLLTKQWFINMQPLAEKSLQHLQHNEIKFYPEYFKNICMQALETLEPWCISRQLIWGHSIPIWYAYKRKSSQNKAISMEGDVNNVSSQASDMRVSFFDRCKMNMQKLLLPAWAQKHTSSHDQVHFSQNETSQIQASHKTAMQEHEIDQDSVKIFVCRNKEDALKEAMQWFKLNECDIYLKQDPDVLDTWFSSALWAFATQNFPNEAFIVNDFLVTGKDILFFWVARMIMMTLYMCDQVPFKAVYLHGLVLDAQGKKMSKMVGNVLNPLELIKEYNSDIMKLGLIYRLIQGRNVSISRQNMELERNFLTKIENAVKFCKLQGVNAEHIFLHNVMYNNASESMFASMLNNTSHMLNSTSTSTLNSMHSWILLRLNKTIDAMQKSMYEWEIANALHELKHFFRDEFCDWFLEASKFRHAYRDSSNATENFSSITSDKIHNNEVDITLHTLGFVMHKILQLLYPFAPIIAQSLLAQLYDDVVLMDWSALKYLGRLIDDGRCDEMFNIIYEIRALKALGFKGNVELDFSCEYGDFALLNGLTKMNCISWQNHTQGLLYTTKEYNSKTYNLKFFLENTEQLLSIKTKCEKDLSEYIKILEETHKRLSDQQFLAKAEQSLIDEMNARLVEFTEYKANREKLLIAIKNLR